MKIDPSSLPKSNKGNILLMLLIVLVVILLIVFGPILLIWSLNTLFPLLAIDYTFKTWLAALLLAGTVSSHSHGKSKN
jgi:hypothetical protein